MILSNVPRLRFEKEQREKRDLPYLTISEETGLSTTTITQLMRREPIKRIDGGTLSTLCKYFGVGVADILTYVPDDAGASESGQERVEAAA